MLTTAAVIVTTPNVLYDSSRAGRTPRGAVQPIVGPRGAGLRFTWRF
jgi:hypothetical protein